MVSRLSKLLVILSRGKCKLFKVTCVWGDVNIKITKSKLLNKKKWTAPNQNKIIKRRIRLKLKVITLWHAKVCSRKCRKKIKQKTIDWSQALSLHFDTSDSHMCHVCTLIPQKNTHNDTKLLYTIGKNLMNPPNFSTSSLINTWTKINEWIYE